MVDQSGKIITSGFTLLLSNLGDVRDWLLRLGFNKSSDVTSGKDVIKPFDLQEFIDFNLSAFVYRKTTFFRQMVRFHTAGPDENVIMVGFSIINHNLIFGDFFDMPPKCQMNIGKMDTFVCKC